MDFSGRSPQPAQPAHPAPQFGGVNNGATNNKKIKSSAKSNNLMRWAAGIFGLLVVVLAVVAIFTLGVGGTKAENSYVDKSKLQAVFLQTGQVYFGNVKDLNSKYVVLKNIYYLQTSSTGSSSSSSSSNTNVSLVKLGCELHAPYDQMVINRDQVTFWENLQSDGQVAKAVATFQKDNPNGQKCSDQSSAPNSSSNVQGSSSTNTNSSSSSTSGQ